jgi:hypothetical protein
MKIWIRRTFTLLALSVTATLGLVAQADPLPAPDAPASGPRIAPAVELLSPPNGVTVTYDTVFTWSHTGAPDKYRLKLLIVETGKRLTVKVPLENCGGAGFCTMTADDAALFEQVKDGFTVKWRVIATYGTEKSKSGTRSITVDTVSAPESLMPGDGTLLVPIDKLSWNAHSANRSYTLIVKDAETNATVIKLLVPASECKATCVVNPFNGSLKQQTQYKWFVRAQGFNGDKAKSPKQSFTTSSWAVAA